MRGYWLKKKNTHEEEKAERDETASTDEEDLTLALFLSSRAESGENDRMEGIQTSGFRKNGGIVNKKRGTVEILIIQTGNRAELTLAKSGEKVFIKSGGEGRSRYLVERDA